MMNASVQLLEFQARGVDGTQGYRAATSALLRMTERPRVRPTAQNLLSPTAHRSVNSDRSKVEHGFQKEPRSAHMSGPHLPTRVRDEDLEVIHVNVGLICESRVSPSENIAPVYTTVVVRPPEGPIKRLNHFPVDPELGVTATA